MTLQNCKISCQQPLQDRGRWVCLLEMRSLNHHQTESVCISATQTVLTNLEVTGLFSALTGKEKDCTLMLMDCLKCTVNLDNFSKTMCTTMYSCKNHFLPCVDIIVWSIYVCWIQYGTDCLETGTLYGCRH